jgi:hypothetical protein
LVYVDPGKTNIVTLGDGLMKNKDGDGRGKHIPYTAKQRRELSGQNMEAKKRAKLLKRKPQGSTVTYKELQERTISSRSPGHIHSIHVGTSRSVISTDTPL